MISIHRAARALAGLLDIKGGATPAQLEDNVRGTIDLSENYAAADLTSQEVQGVGLTNSQASVITIPAGETWRLYALGGVQLGNATHAAAASATCLSLAISFNGIGVPLSNPVLVTPAVSQAYRLGVTLPRPLILLSGTQLQAIVDEVTTAGSYTLTVRALFARILGGS